MAAGSGWGWGVGGGGGGVWGGGGGEGGGGEEEGEGRGKGGGGGGGMGASSCLGISYSLRSIIHFNRRSQESPPTAVLITTGGLAQRTQRHECSWARDI